jgi:DNA-binding PadR family transcriptional regulator
MEYVILGLLLIRTRTLYELKKVFDAKIALFYSASFGSISSAIGKLLEKQWITVQEQVEQGRNKKIYTITPDGAAAFQAWLGSAIPSEKVKDHALTRLFFLGFLSPAERVALIERHLAMLEAQAAELAALEAAAHGMAIPAAQQDIARFQALTLRYGQDYYAFSIAWFQRLLADLKDQTHDHDDTRA